MSVTVGVLLLLLLLKLLCPIPLVCGNGDVRQDRDVLLAHYHTLKREMASCRETERCNLTTLTLQSDTTIKELQRKKDKVS